MVQSLTRSTHLEARIASDALAVVKCAAEIQGCSVSDFVVAAAEEAARKTIEATQLARLSRENQIAFAEAIIRPTAPDASLRRAQDAHRRLVLRTW